MPLLRPFLSRALPVAALCALTVCTAPRATAQIGVGAAAGFNAYALTDAPGYTSGRGAGYHAGAFLDIGEEPFALRFGVFYVDAGDVEAAEVSARFPAPTEEDPRGTETITLLPDLAADVAHLSIPLELHYRFDVGPLTPYGLFGPNVRILLGDAGTLAEETRKSSTVAMAFGAGTLFNGVFGSPDAGGPRLFAEVRYIFDLASTFSEEDLLITRDGTLAPPDRNPDRDDVAQLRVAQLSVDLFLLRAGIVF